MCASAAARPAMTSAIEPIASTTRRTRTRDRASRWIARREMPRRGVQRVLSESVMRGVAIIGRNSRRDSSRGSDSKARAWPTGAMASYEELKARVAMLKRADKEESKSRKAREAKEAAEVARCASRSPLARRGGNAVCASAPTTTTPDPDRARPTAPPLPLSPSPRRAKAEMLQREKENDERLTSARKALNQATERSQRMRAHYEDQVKRLQTKLTRAVAALAEAKETAASDAVAAEARTATELAEAVSRAETRRRALREARGAKATSRAPTERFKSQSVERFEETEASDRDRARAGKSESVRR